MADDSLEEKSSQPLGPALGPVYELWESALEKLKILQYESGYCGKGRKPFHRVHFVFPGANPGVQFDEFVDLCAWLCSVISRDEIFHRDQYDDPSTVVNKLLLALRGLGFDLSFPSQKLKVANGEPVCAVLDFLADKALESRNFRWGTPQYNSSGNDDGEVLGMDDDNEEKKGSGNGGGDDDDEIEDDIDNTAEHQGDDGDAAIGDGTDHNNGRVEGQEFDNLDSSAHDILHAALDPMEWKQEVERVAPKLRQSSAAMGSGSEWRSHVDQTITSKAQIEKIMGETRDDLSVVGKQVADELQRAGTKEKYMNHQFGSLTGDYAQIRKVLDSLESTSSTTNDKVAKMTNELAEITDKLDEMKENFESKDSGIHDTSPLVRMKAALQQIKQESYAFDLRIGVVSHSLLAARVNVSNRRRHAVHSKHKARHGKKGSKNAESKEQHHDDAYISD
jgi:intraflagellar transport protein 57